jgi:hypothetical protein
MKPTSDRRSLIIRAVWLVTSIDTLQLVADTCAYEGRIDNPALGSVAGPDDSANEKVKGIEFCRARGKRGKVDSRARESLIPRNGARKERYPYCSARWGSDSFQGHLPLRRLIYPILRDGDGEWHIKRAFGTPRVISDRFSVCTSWLVSQKWAD